MNVHVGLSVCFVLLFSPNVCLSVLTVHFTVNGLHFQDLPTSLQPKGRQVNKSLPPARLTLY